MKRGDSRHGYSNSSGLTDNLKECLCQLARHDRDDCTVTLYPDFAPLSLYFKVTKQGRLVLNGGMLFHGSHDSGGNGSTPTFSVCLTPTTGWAIRCYRLLHKMEKVQAWDYKDRSTWYELPDSVTVMIKDEKHLERIRMGYVTQIQERLNQLRGWENKRKNPVDSLALEYEFRNLVRTQVSSTVIKKERIYKNL